MWLPLLLGLVGCGADKTGDEGGDTSSSDTDTSDTDSGDVSASAPSVVSVRSADCAPNVDSIDTWSVSIGVSDPEGDVASRGSTVTVLDGTEELATYELACGSDACYGSWTATTDGIDCTVGGASVFRFVVVDEMGNTSAPYDHTPI